MDTAGRYSRYFRQQEWSEVNERQLVFLVKTTVARPGMMQGSVVGYATRPIEAAAVADLLQVVHGPVAIDTVSVTHAVLAVLQQQLPSLETLLKRITPATPVRDIIGGQLVEAHGRYWGVTEEVRELMPSSLPRPPKQPMTEVTSERQEDCKLAGHFDQLDALLG